MDSKLVSVVHDLELESEGILQAGRDQAASVQQQAHDAAARLIQERQAAADQEAKLILAQKRTQTEKDLEQLRARESAVLADSLRAANIRLDKAVQLILDKLRKS